MRVASRSCAIVPLRFTIAHERAAAYANALHSCYAPLHNCTEHWLKTIALHKPFGICSGLLPLTAARCRALGNN